MLLWFQSSYLQFCCINTPPKHSSLQMKMPGSVGTKKAKAVEQLLEELGVGMWEILFSTASV